MYDVVLIDDAMKEVDIGLVRVCGERIGKEDYTANLLEADEGSNLRVATKWARGALEAAQIVSSQYILEHLHSRGGACQPEALERLFVANHKLSHLLFHIVVRDEGEAPHRVALERVVIAHIPSK